MASPGQDPAPPGEPNAQDASASESIKALTDIEKDVPKLLRSAGSAVAVLTNGPVNNTSLSGSDHATHQSGNLEDRKTAFLDHVGAYYNTLRAVQDALEAQTTALEDAGILSAVASKPDDAGVTNRGLGNMDSAWLNQRSRDVGSSKEEEIRGEAKVLLEKAKELKDVIMHNGS